MKNSLKISKLVHNNPKREKELQKKLSLLANEYFDVSMLFMNNLKIERVEEDEEPLIIFPEKGKDSAHHFIKGCVFIGDDNKNDNA